MATTAPYHLPPHMLTGDSTFITFETVKVTLEQFIKIPNLVIEF